MYLVKTLVFPKHSCNTWTSYKGSNHYHYTSWQAKQLDMAARMHKGSINHSARASHDTLSIHNCKTKTQSWNFVFIFKVKLVWSPFLMWQLMMDWKLLSREKMTFHIDWFSIYLFILFFYSFLQKPNFQWMWYWQLITLFLWRETTPTLRSNHHLEWRLQRNTLMSNAHCGWVPQSICQRHQGGEM